jgi:5-methylcytosine-specific restriction endonuclease McrA
MSTAPHAWYTSVGWLRRRRHQLRVEPLCEFCLKRGMVVPATIADHIEPHRGDRNAFVLGRLQSLCIQCHNSAKRQSERRGYFRGTGLDGMPLDKNHPVYR